MRILRFFLGICVCFSVAGCHTTAPTGPPEVDTVIEAAYGNRIAIDTLFKKALRSSGEVREAYGKSLLTVRDYLGVKDFEDELTYLRNEDRATIEQIVSQYERSVTPPPQVRVQEI